MIVKKIYSRWHFFEGSAQKAAHLSSCVCTGRWVYLCYEGLYEMSRVAEFVFCSLYISSQLSDKTDKSAPPSPPLHLLLLLSSFLVSFFFLNHTLLGLTVVLGIDLPVKSKFKHQARCCVRSQTQGVFFSMLSQSSWNEKEEKKMRTEFQNLI